MGTASAKRDARSLLPAGESPEQRWARRGTSPRGGVPSAAPEMESVIGFDALMESMEKCMRGCAWKQRSIWCWEHRSQLCAKLSDDLYSGRYRPRKPVVFDVSKPKPRTILATDFLDRVVQRSFNDNLIYPVMSRSWIYDNCACQKGKGTDFARSRLHAHMERCFREAGGPPSVGVCDISGYYDHMLHSVAESRFEAKLPDWGSDFAAATLRNQYGDGPTGYKPGSQMVQIVGIDYLDPLDHLVKERLGVRHYLRYMDDFIIVHQDPVFIAEALSRVASAIADVGLALNRRKTRILMPGEPVPFLGFNHFLDESGRSYMLVLPEKVKQARRDMAVLARLVRDGRMTIEQAGESWRERREHISKGCSRRVLASLDEYVSNLGIGDGIGHRDREADR